MSQLSDKKTGEFVRKRVKRLVDERGVALSAIALRSGVEQGTVRVLYEQDGHKKQTIMRANAEKLEKGLDDLERSLGMVKRCTSCGKELPYGRFYFKSGAKDGIDAKCKDCCNSRAKKGKTMNNGTENAITAETVRKVKAEDKRDVESKFMAPYFRLTPKQLDEVRKGMWDKLLLTPKVPERANSVLEAVEKLRAEVAELRREVETVMVEMGVEVGE